MRQSLLEHKKSLRLKRKLRVRRFVKGTMLRPRISIFKSNKYLYAQAIDDEASNTIVSIDGRKFNVGNNKDSARKLGNAFAESLKLNGISSAVYDRNGYLYHGVVAEFANALRENGISI